MLNKPLPSDQQAEATAEIDPKELMKQTAGTLQDQNDSDIEDNETTAATLNNGPDT